MVGPFLGRGPALSSVEQQGGAHGAMGLWVHEPMVTHTACGQNRSHGKANPGEILVRWLVPGLGCPIGQLLLVGRAGEAAIGHLIKPSRPLSRFFHALSSPVSLLVSRRRSLWLSSAVHRPATIPCSYTPATTITPLLTSATPSTPPPVIPRVVCGFWLFVVSR